MPAKTLTVMLLTLVGLCLGALLAFGDSSAPVTSPDRIPQSNQTPSAPQAPEQIYEFLEGSDYAPQDCAATLRVYVSYIPTTFPSWRDPYNFATDAMTQPGACSDWTRIVNRASNGAIESIDYPFYIRNQNRQPGEYKVTFLGLSRYITIYRWPPPTPTATPIYSDSVTGKVLDNRGRPLPGAQIDAKAPGWVKQPSANPWPLYSVDCPTSTTCFAVGNTIVATTDSGAHWQSQTSSRRVGLRDVSCPTVTTCYAVGPWGAIMATTDGGALWSSQASGTTAELREVSCSNATTCTAVAGDGAILATTDGGATWNSQASGTTDVLLAVSCPTTTRCFVSGSSSLILATTDGGMHWSQQSRSEGGAYLETISCPTSATCFAFGTGTVMTTTNGGASWGTAAFPDPNPNGYLMGGSCPTANTCSIIWSNGRKYVTSDGGATWQRDPDYRMNYTANEMGLKDIFCPATTTCFVVGDEGLIGRFQIDLRSATTDAAGNYALERVAPNTYTLSATLGNHTFTPATRSVTVPPSATGQDFVDDFAQPTLYLPLILNAMGGQ